MTNQEALEYLKKEMGADFIFSDDNISKCLNTLQKAINELQNLKENYIGFEDMNYELQVHKKALSNTIDIFNIDNPYEPMTVEGQLKGAREELKNG